MTNASRTTARVDTLQVTPIASFPRTIKRQKRSLFSIDQKKIRRILRSQESNITQYINLRRIQSLTATMPMRRCNSEVSMTDMIMSNIKIPRSKSMLSLSQALTSARQECSLNQSQLSLAVSRQILKTKKERFDPIDRANSSGDEDYNPVTRRRSRRRRRASRASITARNGDGPHEGRQSMERSAHSKGACSRETSRSRETSAKRICGKAVIKRADKMSTLARTEKIPKWINVEIKVDIPLVPPTAVPEEPAPTKPKIKLHKDLVSLTDLAMILSNNLDHAIAKGLYEPKESGKRKKRADVETLSTATSCSMVSSLHASLGDIPIGVILSDYQCWISFALPKGTSDISTVVLIATHICYPTSLLLYCCYNL